MGWKKGLLFVVVTLLLLTGLKGLQPTFRHWKNERQVDELLRTDAFFRTIVADHPALREALRVAIVRAYDTQRPEDLLRVQNEIIGPLLPKYM